MKKVTIALFALLVSSASHADIIRCSFTEPFVTTSYDILKKRMTRIDISEDKPVVLNDVTLSVVSTGVIELRQNGKLIQTLTLTGKGRDGMSDLPHLYEVKDNLMGGSNMGNGGCSRLRNEAP